MQPISDDSADMKRLPMHEAIKPLAWLIGTWRSTAAGKGQFPTIEPFSYCEEISFSSIGQPMLNYRARSWNSETKNPMHYEVGFLKRILDTNRVSLLLSHNFGLTTIEEGTVDDKTIKLRTTRIARPTEGTRGAVVTELQREFRLVDGCLQHTLCMATENTPELQQHLHAVYSKSCQQSEEA